MVKESALDVLKLILKELRAIRQNTALDEAFCRAIHGDVYYSGTPTAGTRLVRNDSKLKIALLVGGFLSGGGTYWIVGKVANASTRIWFITNTSTPLKLVLYPGEEIYFITVNAGAVDVFIGGSTIQAEI